MTNCIFYLLLLNLYFIQGLRILVQSDRHPEYLDTRVENYIQQLKQNLEVSMYKIVIVSPLLVCGLISLTFTFDIISSWRDSSHFYNLSSERYCTSYHPRPLLRQLTTQRWVCAMCSQLLRWKLAALYDLPFLIAQYFYCPNIL